jgi:hypothetical protein
MFSCKLDICRTDGAGNPHKQWASLSYGSLITAFLMQTRTLNPASYRCELANGSLPLSFMVLSRQLGTQKNTRSNNDISDLRVGKSELWKAVEAAEGRTAHNNVRNGANGMESNTWKPWKPTRLMCLIPFH